MTNREVRELLKITGKMPLREEGRKLVKTMMIAARRSGDVELQKRLSQARQYFKLQPGRCLDCGKVVSPRWLRCHMHSIANRRRRYLDRNNI